MKYIKIAIILLFLFSCTKKKDLCDEYSQPYYRYKTIIKGENITIRNAFKELVKNEQNITPSNGFITVKIHTDKNGNLCSLETYQIDENYQKTIFNNNDLINKVKNISNGLTNWIKDKKIKTFYLIRLKIEDGKIKEVF